MAKKIHINTTGGLQQHQKSEKFMMACKNSCLIKYTTKAVIVDTKTAIPVVGHLHQEKKLP